MCRTVAQSLSASLLSLAALLAICLPAAAFNSSRFAAGQQALQQQVAQEQALQDVTLAAPRHLRPRYASHLGLLSPERARASVLLLHGYTAGPWQLEELGARLNAAGFHYYAPRLPGHGWMDAARRGTGERLVALSERQRYETFLDTAYQALSDLQVPVYAVGLSGGGNLALRLAEKQPEIARVVAVAPFLGPDYPAAWSFGLVEVLNGLSFGGLGQALQAVPYGENTLSTPDEDLPHTQGHINNAYTAYRMGAEVQQLQARVQFFTTAGDDLSGVDPVGVLFRRLGGAARHGWFHYRAADRMPHAMISPRQHDPAAIGQLHGMIVHFLQTGQRFWHPPAPPDWYCARRHSPACL